MCAWPKRHGFSAWSTNCPQTRKNLLAWNVLRSKRPFRKPRLPSGRRIYAVGDIAAAEHPLFGGHIRTEHWANALKQPAVAAVGMLGRPGEYAELPYFFTDQYDLGMEYVGHAPHFDRVVFRGDVAGREFVAFWLDGANRVLAGMNVNVWDVLDDVKALITSRSPVDPDKLADPQLPLAGLLS